MKVYVLTLPKGRPHLLRRGPVTSQASLTSERVTCRDRSQPLARFSLTFLPLLLTLLVLAAAAAPLGIRLLFPRLQVGI